MLKMVDGTGIIGVDMVCPLGGTVSPPQPPNFDKVEVEGVGSLMLPNSLKVPLERVELIGNSVQGENPAPENPQEIKSAGRKSKNLFDINYFKDKSNLKMLQCEGFTLLGIICNVKPNTEYTLSANLTEAKYNLNIANKTKRFSLTSAPSRTLTSNDDGTLYIGLFNTTADLINMDDFMQQYKNIQLEEGNKTDYEPYSDKYLLNVKVNGKNLFDQSKLISGFINMTTGAFEESANTLFANSLILDKPILLKSGQTLVTSVDNKYAQNFLRYRTYRKDGTFLINNEPISFSYKATEDLYVIALFYNGMSEEDKKSLQIEISDDPTTYEPYTEQSVQITLDEPLRGIGEYKDTITKDGVIRKIKRVVFDGSEDEKWGIAIERENVINFVSTQFSDAIKINEHQRTMMDKLKWSSGVWGRDEVGQDMFARILRMNMPKTLTPDLQTFKTWLSQNPLTVDYVLAEPATEPLPGSVQAQLQALHSENGTTHVFVDSGEVPCGIKLTYRKEK